MKLFSKRAREGCRQFPERLASIWRMRSRVTLKSSPTLPAFAHDRPYPGQRKRITFSSRGLRGLQHIAGDLTQVVSHHSLGGTVT